MPNGTIGESERTNDIQTLLSADLEFEASRTAVWNPLTFTPPDGALPTGGKMAGKTVRLRFSERLPISKALTAIPERSDIDSEQDSHVYVDVTVDEYGNTMQDTEWVEVIQKGDTPSELSSQMAENVVSVLDRLAMRVFIGASVHAFPNNHDARADLDATNDTLLSSGVGLGWIAQWQAMLRTQKTPGYDKDKDGRAKYHTIVNPIVSQDFNQATGFLPALQYREGSNAIFNGEIGEFNGLKIMESNQGKVYPGAGTVAQTATTLSSSVAKGDTTIVVASATGLAVGDYITIGTVEATGNADTQGIETVLITGVNGTTLTIAGAGFDDTAGSANVPALRYAHSSGDAVTEAATVAAIPIFGPRSVMKAYAQKTGPMGQARVSGPFDKLGRFKNYGWYAIAGWARAKSLGIVVPEVATAYNTILINE